MAKPSRRTLLLLKVNLPNPRRRRKRPRSVFILSSLIFDVHPSFKQRKPKVTVTVTEGEIGETEPAAPTPEGESKPARRNRPSRPRRATDEEPTGEPSKSVLFVANLGFNIDDAALGDLFTEAGINVVSARIVRRQYGRPRKSKGYGFVDVGNEEEQKKAIAALEGKEVGGRLIAVKIAVNAQGDEANEEKAVVEEEGTPEVATVDT